MPTFRKFLSKNAVESHCHLSFLLFPVTWNMNILARTPSWKRKTRPYGWQSRKLEIACLADDRGASEPVLECLHLDRLEKEKSNSILRGLLLLSAKPNPFKKKRKVCLNLQWILLFFLSQNAFISSAFSQHYHTSIPTLILMRKVFSGKHYLIS